MDFSIVYVEMKVPIPTIIVMDYSVNSVNSNNLIKFGSNEVANTLYIRLFETHTRLYNRGWMKC